MPIQSTITSWNQDGLDWTDPNPLDARYWEALRVAILERYWGYSISPYSASRWIEEPLWDADFSEEGVVFEVAETIQNYIFNFLKLGIYASAYPDDPRQRPIRGYIDRTKDVSGKVYIKDLDYFICNKNICDKLGVDGLVQVVRNQPAEYTKEFLIQCYNILNLLVWVYIEPQFSFYNWIIEFKTGEDYREDTRAGNQGNFASLKTKLASPIFGSWTSGIKSNGYFKGDGGLYYNGSGTYFNNYPPLIRQIKKYARTGGDLLFQFGLNIYEQCGRYQTNRIRHGYFKDYSIDLVSSYSTPPGDFTITIPSDNALSKATELIEADSPDPYTYSDSVSWNTSYIFKFDVSGGFNFKI